MASINKTFLPCIIMSELDAEWPAILELLRVING